MANYNENNGSRIDESVNGIGAEEHGHGICNEKDTKALLLLI